MNGTGHYRNVVVCDFEYEIADGDLPRVLCMVAYILDAELRHVRTIQRWRGEFGPAPPFDIGPDTLFVAYSAWAEMTCFLVLGWRFPVHIFDLHTAFLSVSNILLPHNPDEVRKKPRKRLSDACRRYGIVGWESIDKEEIAKAIGEGRWREYGEAAVYEYCEEDVRALDRIAARPAGRIRTLRRHRPASDRALERVQRQVRRKDPGARHADRHVSVEPGDGEQGGGHRRTDPALRPQPGQRSIRSIRPKGSGATSGLHFGWWPPASRSGRG